MIINLAETKSWFKRGSEGIDEVKRNEQKAQERKDRCIGDFWLEKDTSAKIIFVDESAEDAFYCYRHGIKHSGNFLKLTCSRGFKPCPICEKGKSFYPSLVAHYTVIDLREYVNKSGETIRASKRLYAVKGKTMQQRIAELSRKYRGLRGKAFEVKRYNGSTEPASGSIIDLATNDKNETFPTIDIKEKFNKDIIDAHIPYDYEKVLAFPTNLEFAEAGFTPDISAARSLQNTTGDAAAVEIEYLI